MSEDVKAIASRNDIPDNTKALVLAAVHFVDRMSADHPDIPCRIIWDEMENTLKEAAEGR